MTKTYKNEWAVTVREGALSTDGVVLVPGEAYRQDGPYLVFYYVSEGAYVDTALFPHPNVSKIVRVAEENMSEPNPILLCSDKPAGTCGCA